MISNFVYTDETLFINLEGDLDQEEINKVRKKMYYIILEYNIDNIVIDIKNVEGIDKRAFSHFLDDYNISCGGNLEIIK